MAKKKTVIAIIGMAGSGKTEAINYLQKKNGWPKVYFGAVTFDRLSEQGLDINWANEKIMREQIRKEMGMGAYATLSLPRIHDELKRSEVVLIESLYSWDEYKILKEEFKENFLTIATYASPAKRFERLSKRPVRPIKNLHEFKDRDYSEIENIAKGGPIALADFTIMNEGNKTSLHRQLSAAIKKITN
jgi:dephospho-CoA kinase